MKLLGQFKKEIGKEYFDLLKVKGIEVKAEEVSVYKRITSFYGKIVVELKLFVDDKDYDKAKPAIKEYERKQHRVVEIDGQMVNRVILMITISVLIIMTLYFYVFNK